MMNKVDQIIGYKKYEVKLPKDRQVTKNKSKGGNDQIDTKREKDKMRAFGEERKKFLVKWLKTKKKIQVEKIERSQKK